MILESHSSNTQVSWFQDSMDQGIHIVKVPQFNVSGKAWAFPVRKATRVHRKHQGSRKESKVPVF